MQALLPSILHQQLQFFLVFYNMKQTNHIWVLKFKEVLDFSLNAINPIACQPINFVICLHGIWCASSLMYSQSDSREGSFSDV